MNTQNAPEDIKVSLKLKLAALWTSFMFLYIYVDYFSLYMPGKVNRWANIIIAAVYIPYTLFNLAGEAWMHMVFGAVVEVVLLCLIIRYAWKWPRIEA